MKSTFVLFFLALSCSAYGHSVARGVRNAIQDFGNTTPESIVNGSRDGRNVPIEEAPFMALVYRGDAEKGSDPHLPALIISDRYLLSTSSHFGRLYVTDVVYLGETDLTSLKFKNKYIISNIMFYEEPFEFLALIKLEKRIEFNDKQRPIALLSPNDIIEEYEDPAQVDIYGFGFTKRNPDDKTVVLKTKKISIPMKKLLTESMLLVDYKEDYNSCPGDAGTPLLMGDKLLAINMRPEICGDPHNSEVFLVRSVLPYYDWILHQVGEKDFYFAQQNAYRRGYTAKMVAILKDIYHTFVY